MGMFETTRRDAGRTKGPGLDYLLARYIVRLAAAGVASLASAELRFPWRQETISICG